jgi:uncharacterized membrane protein (UPF0136 family)
MLLCTLFLFLFRNNNNNNNKKLCEKNHKKHNKKRESFFSLLLCVMGLRAVKSGKVMPAGGVAILSLASLVVLSI